MKEYIKIAWRNIWRNKRRTIITAASIFVAVFLALIMRSFQVGSYDHMIKNMVQSYTGYIQIHSNGFWDDQTIDNTFACDEKLMSTIRNNEGVTDIVPRLQTYILASSGEHTKGAMIMGVNPKQENNLTKLKNRLIEGVFIDSESNSVLVAEKLAKFLKLKVKDTIVFLGQGYHGESAAGKYEVSGILKFPLPDMNKSMVYMNLKTTQELMSVSAENRLTALAININNKNDLDRIISSIKNSLDADLYEVMSWEEMSVELVQQIETDSASGLIMLAILYMVITFGVFGTVLMMISERRREFGVMIAVGMRKYKLVLITVIEMIFISLVGIISGAIVSTPLIYYWYTHPIRYTGELAKSIEQFGMEPVMPFAFQFDIYLNQALIVLLLVIIACIYPIYSILRLTAIKALRA